ncbi:U-box domain-containing protein 9-like [Phoenix dactylifera]|uniref:RING-type E3 ubiquitin transferase n=1 Tax=Phoenix dactylifera TaxID=42345 RepID=A0A8B7D1W3_PHODC|nr:U-box domain-containing protein 9-like [Phoenix dactylifera]
MAKLGAGEAAAAAKKTGELKRELRRLVRAIAEDDDTQIKTFDEAARALAALRDVKFGGNGNSKGKRSPSPLSKETKKDGKIGSPEIPQHFLCPISSELMRDPVILASGQTYERPFIQEWLNSGNRTCPQTQQILPNTTLIPNHAVRSMISEWCAEHGIPLPAVESQEEGLITKDERDALNELLDKISSSSSIPEQKQAVKELRLLTKRNRSFRALLGGKPDAISLLLSLLSVPGLDGDPELQEDTVTTILNLSIHDSNKKIVGADPQAIPLLIDALKNGTMETRGNAAAALFTLSALDSNKLKIGESGAIKPLLELLEQGCETARTDAASAIFNICMAPENRMRAVKEGAVHVVLKAIEDQSLVDGPLAILTLLSGDPDAMEQIAESGMPCLLGIMRESACDRNKENAVAALFSVCMHDRLMLREVGKEEKLHGTVSALAQNGTSRARRKAAGILERLKKSTRSPNYSC